jgi:hypothetical protein
VSNIWQGLIGNNLANIDDTVEVASTTEFKVIGVKKCRVTKEWLYTLKNTKSKKVTDCVPEIELSKVNGVSLL